MNLADPPAGTSHPTVSERWVRISRSLGHAGLMLGVGSFFLVILAVSASSSLAAIFSFLVLSASALCGLAAVSSGAVAMARSDPSSDPPSTRAAAIAALKTGFVALAVAVFVTLFLIPNYIRAGTGYFRQGSSHGRKNECIYHLRHLDGAKEQWAFENKQSTNATPSWDDLIGTDKYIRVRPRCPEKGIYTLGTLAIKPRCSIAGHTL